MDQETLVEELRYLGIDVEDHRALLVLPLVQVAWCDGDIHPKEVEALEAAALKLNTCQEGEAARMMANWQKHSPSAEYYRRGREVLLGLCIRGTGPGRDIRKATIDQMLAEAKAVAAAAGGFFGLRTMSAAERAVIAELEALFSHTLQYNSNDTPWEDPREEMWDDDDWEYGDDEPAIKLSVRKVEARVDPSTRRPRGITLNVGGNDDEPLPEAGDS